MQNWAKHAWFRITFGDQGTVAGRTTPHVPQKSDPNGHHETAATTGERHRDTGATVGTEALSTLRTYGSPAHSVFIMITNSELGVALVDAPGDV
jgi:hypothetical protein